MMLFYGQERLSVECWNTKTNYWPIPDDTPRQSSEPVQAQTFLGTPVLIKLKKYFHLHLIKRLIILRVWQNVGEFISLFYLSPFDYQNQFVEDMVKYNLLTELNIEFLG